MSMKFEVVIDTVHKRDGRRPAHLADRALNNLWLEEVITEPQAISNKVRTFEVLNNDDIILVEQRLQRAFIPYKKVP